MSPLTLIASDRFALHVTPPGHPESPERAEVMAVIAGRWREDGGEVLAPRPVTEKELARVHAPAHLRRIAATAGRAAALDPDTYTSPDSYETALLAAGAAVMAVERAMASGAPAIALVRPPGHHAERDRAMGFCLFNNVAVAAAHARAHGAARVAIVDYDVHHGNGTQHVFERDPTVLYVSTHQYPFYPGTGAADEIGEDAGAGFTVNLPLEAGSDSGDYRHVFDDVILPVLREFQPDLLLVSAGFDAHERDPLGQMRLPTEAFAAMTGALRAVAGEYSHSRLVLVTEGGYNLRALGASLDAVIGTVAEDAAPPEWPAGDAGAGRGRASAAQAKCALARFWRF